VRRDYDAIKIGIYYELNSENFIEIIEEFFSNRERFVIININK
jgi:hypothetical protein